MKRKALAVFLAAVLAGTMLSACGNASVKEDETAAETQGEAASDESGTQEEEEAVPEETAEEQEDMRTVYLPVRSTLFMAYEGSESPEFSGKTEYEYDDHGNLIKTSSYWEENIIAGLEEAEYEYDDDGRIAKKISYTTNIDYEGNIEGDREKISEEGYEYDDSGMLLKSTKTEYFETEEWEAEQDPKMIWDQIVTVSEYDEYGNVVKENYSYSHPDDSESTYEFTYEHEYDSTGQLTKSTKSRNDADDIKLVYLYDEHGNKTEECQVVTEESGLTPTSATCEYTYDEQGRVIKTVYGMEPSDFWDFADSLTEYEYDANGNIIKTIEGNGEYITEYEYMEMQIPDIKNSYIENELIVFCPSNVTI